MNDKEILLKGMKITTFKDKVSASDYISKKLVRHPTSFIFKVQKSKSPSTIMNVKQVQKKYDVKVNSLWEKWTISEGTEKDKKDYANGRKKALMEYEENMKIAKNQAKNKSPSKKIKLSGRQAVDEYIANMTPQQSLTRDLLRNSRRL